MEHLEETRARGARLPDTRLPRADRGHPRPRERARRRRRDADPLPRARGQGGAGDPHIEYPIHTEVLAARPDVGAVARTHADDSVALAAAGGPLLPYSHAATLFVPPEVPRFTLTADLIKTPELGRALAESLGSGHAVFLVNHGIVTTGADVQDAVVRAVLLERACTMQLKVRAHGGTPGWSSDDEALAKRESVYPQPARRQMWDHLVRRLEG